MAVQPEGFRAPGHEDLAISGAFGDQGIGANEAFVPNDNVMADGSVHGEKTAFPDRNHAGDVGAGGKPAVIADRAVVPNHRSTPNKDVVSKPHAGMNHHIVHDEAIFAILAILGQT
jgi:hypothetical protein